MGRWTVRNGSESELFVAESTSDGHLSLHIPTPDPVLVTIRLAEHIRLAIGSAIGEAQAGRPS